MSSREFGNYIEKRIFKRIDSSLKVSLLYGGRKIQAKCANISCGGIYLNIKNIRSRVAELKKSLEVAIHLPNRKTPVVMVADVIRHDPQDGLALKFQGLYNDNVLEIEKYIKSKVH